MFVKLNYKFSKPIYAVTQGLNTFTGVDNKGIDYKKIWSPEPEMMYKILPKKYWEDFYLTVMTINRNIPPHTDSDILTTINFYIETKWLEAEQIFTRKMRVMAVKFLKQYTNFSKFNTFFFIDYLLFIHIL